MVKFSILSISVYLSLILDSSISTKVFQEQIFPMAVFYVFCLFLWGEGGFSLLLALFVYFGEEYFDFRLFLIWVYLRIAA